VAQGEGALDASRLFFIEKIFRGVFADFPPLFQPMGHSDGLEIIELEIAPPADERVGLALASQGVGRMDGRKSAEAVRPHFLREMMVGHCLDHLRRQPPEPEEIARYVAVGYRERRLSWNTLYSRG